MFAVMESFVKSDYDVRPRKDCEKIRNGSKASLLVQRINVLKCCLAADVSRFDKDSVERLNFLQRNRHIMRMTEAEFIMLVPYANHYQKLLERAKGKRIIVTCEIWYSMSSLNGYTKQEMFDKVDEIIENLVNNNLYKYTDIEGVITKEKILL